MRKIFGEMLDFLFSKWSGTEVKIDGEPHLIIKEGDILAIVER